MGKEFDLSEGRSRRPLWRGEIVERNEVGEEGEKEDFVDTNRGKGRVFTRLKGKGEKRKAAGVANCRWGEKGGGQDLCPGSFPVP